MYPKLSTTILDKTILMISFIARDGFSVVVVVIIFLSLISGPENTGCRDHPTPIYTKQL